MKAKLAKGTAKPGRRYPGRGGKSRQARKGSTRKMRRPRARSKARRGVIIAPTVPGGPDITYTTREVRR